MVLTNPCEMWGQILIFRYYFAIDFVKNWIYNKKKGAIFGAKKEAVFMVAVKGADIKYNFKAICDRVFGGETIIVSRPKNENVVLISEKRYEELERMQRNAEYLAKLDRGIEQIQSGTLQYHDLIEVDE